VGLAEVTDLNSISLKENSSLRVETNISP